MTDLLPRNQVWPYFLAMLLPLTAGCMTLFVGTVRAMSRRDRTETPAARSILLPLINVLCMAASALLMTFTFAETIPASDYRFNGSVEWLRIGPDHLFGPAKVLSLGYHIDRLTAVLFAMVTVVAALIFMFALGYMADERNRAVEDHEAHVARRGRMDRFFAYLSLFVVAMLALLVSNNLLQIFICWELVGVFSYLLIGFYHERRSAGLAASKAFIVNRVGDAGFLVGIVIAWSCFGSLELTNLKVGVGDAASSLRHTDPVWVQRMLEEGLGRPLTPEKLEKELNDARTSAEARLAAYGGMTRALWVIIGLGIFAGCVGKSAQVPLYVWLPDAMAGPTPVSALIHAATMVAAGVYLVARCNELFPPEVLLVIAYTGAATMLLGATAACVQTDIKKVLAYSTCSQLGAMMLALGVGGWAAGMFHLVTHAFFKALLFLAAGSVIHGLQHEQDIRRMGGLRGKMPIAAVAMLFGVMAISGAPLFSGWYSKEAILASAARFALLAPSHTVLFVIPLCVAGLTAFYMFRLWFLVFFGEPRDRLLHDHAKESPWVMTMPLLILAFLSLTIGWGWPVWSSEVSYLGGLLREFERLHSAMAFELSWREWHSAEMTVKSYHLALEIAAGSIALVGASVAMWRYSLRMPVFEPAGWLGRFFTSAWGLDALYARLFRRTTVRLAFAAAAADKRPGNADGDGSDPAAQRLDLGTLDGWLNAIGQGAVALGTSARHVQVGRVRAYVLALGLTVVGLLGMLAAGTRW